MYSNHSRNGVSSARYLDEPRFVEMQNFPSARPIDTQSYRTLSALLFTRSWEGEKCWIHKFGKCIII